MEKSKIREHNPHISRQEVSFLWSCDYWDGPLSGICSYRGQRYWFEAIEPEQDNYGYPRTMGVYILSAAELQAQEECQRRFQANEFEKFYTWYKQQPPWDYRRNEMMGWFEL